MSDVVLVCTLPPQICIYICIATCIYVLVVPALEQKALATTGNDGLLSESGALVDCIWLRIVNLLHWMSISSIAARENSFLSVARASFSSTFLAWGLWWASSAACPRCFFDLLDGLIGLLWLIGRTYWTFWIDFLDFLDGAKADLGFQLVQKVRWTCWTRFSL